MQLKVFIRIRNEFQLQDIELYTQEIIRRPLEIAMSTDKFDKLRSNLQFQGNINDVRIMGHSC